MECSEKVYVANKHNLAQLTNIHFWDGTGGLWSPNLINAVTPFEFLPNPAMTDDLVIFGINRHAAHTRQFNSLVFDIERIPVPIAMPYTTAWRCCVVGAGIDPTLWTLMDGVALHDVLDNTNANGVMTGIAFDTLGVNSVQWENERMWPIDPQVGANPALGVEGYWVCLHVTSAPTGAVPPRQQNRGIYTVLWPYIDISADDIGGDLPAIPRITLMNESDGSGVLFPLTKEPVLYQNNVLLALRSLERYGIDCSDFSPWFNMTSEQNAPGVTVAIPGAAAGITENNAEWLSATGTSFEVAWPAPQEQGLAEITIDAAYASQYYGRYHAYVVGLQSAGLLSELALGLVVSTFDATWDFVSTVESHFYGNVGEHHIIADLGEISIGAPGQLLGTEDVDIFMYLYYRAIAGSTPDFSVFSMVLMPVDEWTGEYASPDAYNAGCGARGDPADHVAQERRYLMIDGYGNPRTRIRAPMFSEVDAEVKNMWKCFGAPPRIPPNIAQRLWIFQGMGDVVVGPLSLYARPELTMSVELLVEQLYSSMRGGN